MVSELIKKYIWLIDTVSKEGDRGITFSEINDRWERTEMSGGESYAWRTFQNHREQIADVFGVEIACRKSDNAYYIADRAEMKDLSGFRKWMLETVSVNNSINMCGALRSRILLEEQPSSKSFLSDILEAMRNNCMIMFDYRPYWSSEAVHYYNFEPYALKMFRRRWYLLGKYGNHTLRIFALDRMENMDISTETFLYPKNFDAEDFFSCCFGIIADDELEVKRVVLKVKAFQANYFRSLPLHASQQELERNETYSLFSYRLKPTFDFRQELLSHGSAVEVLEPLSLRRS
ncbi:MAG: WYL domain-containing protein, partial [Bacteroidales bacterium]|nr:WYL domain-containing protein [Bacteroidales bacterium]